MRNRLVNIVALALLLPALSHAATNLTAKLVKPDGSVQVKGTYVKLQLMYCGANAARVIGTGIIPQTVQQFFPNSTGNISVPIYGNDVITCGAITGNTRWRISTYVDNVQTASADYNVIGSAFDLNTATPSTVAPVVIAPTGDNTYLRLDGGNIAGSTLFIPVFANPPALGTGTPNSIDGTVVTAHDRFVGNLYGNVFGNVTGNLTGNVTGNVTGSLYGNADTATLATTANHALNLPADFSSQSGSNPAPGTFTNLRVTGQITAGSTPITITTPDGHVDVNALSGQIPTSLLGFQIQGATSSGCNVSGGGSAWLTCSTTLTWPTAWADTNYHVSCTGVAPTGGYPSKLFINGITKTASTVTVITADAGNSGDGYTQISCVGMHY